MMKKTWLPLAVSLGLTLAGAARAADNTVVGVGTGAVAGAVVGGPVGAVIGAVAGGFIGANSRSARPRYRRRARYGTRRRTAEAAPHAVGSPVEPGPTMAPARLSSSEVSTTPVAATGGIQRGWRDPR